MEKTSEFIINFQPIGKRVSTDSSQSLLNSAQDAGLGIASICGGVGICDSCRIRLINGKVSAPTLEELALFSESELAAGFRLACQSYPQSDLTIDIPSESLTAPQRLQIEGQVLSIKLDPAIIPYNLNITTPTIHDLRADTSRLKDCLPTRQNDLRLSIKYAVLETISETLRANNWQITLAMRNEEVVAILPMNTPILGLAIDVGTTKLAAYLCDMRDGKILAKAGVMNPQTAFGEDVISRISYSNTVTSGRKTLQTRLIDTLNELIVGLCLIAKKDNPIIASEQIVEAVVVGNTAMHHLFAGLPVQQLGIAPYVPAVSDPLEINARDIGLHISPGAVVYLPSNIAGYVGADHVSMLLSTQLTDSPDTKIALDIGTNTEISLFHNNQIYACSCASGPAFEGAHIKAGMRAAPGAIERVQVIQGELRTQTIDNLAPIGICGSGILDSIACLLDSGVIDHRGSFINGKPFVREVEKKREYVLVDRLLSGNGRDIVITRQDINEIQLAKGAIRSGIEALLDVAKINKDQIEEFIIAGAFGSYINIPSAIRIGMFPSLPIEKFRQVGNAAGEGARRMLLSMEQRKYAEQIAKQVRYIELSTYPRFTDLFSKSLSLGS